SSSDVACHVTLRVGVIHAMERSYHASTARSVTKADRQVERSDRLVSKQVRLRPSKRFPVCPESGLPDLGNYSLRPTLGERRHRRLARRLVAVRRREAAQWWLQSSAS